MNYANYNHNKEQVEKMYFTGENSIAEISEKLNLPKNRISAIINNINDIRKSEKINPEDGMKYLEQKLFKAIETEQADPSFENKAATNNLQEIYCKKLME